MVIFEDMHWIDEESQAFLNLLADSIGTARVLLLVNYRPEYRHEWNGKTYYTQLRLDPLGRESADEMLRSLLGDGAELAPLKRMIIEKTEGNPLFIEETVEVLFEDGALERNGTVKLTRPLSQLSIPPTVQDILASRIDRLTAEQKELLQVLAVIGTEFPLSLVRKVVGRTEEDLEQMLAALQLSEFIYEQPASGETEYIFKHALTHDVSYNSMLNERRKMLHERIGAALEGVYSASLDDHIAELAHHYGRSVNAAKAVEYCRQACERSTDRASYVEAMAYLENGLARLQELPDDDRRAELELDLRISADIATLTTKGWDSVGTAQALERVAELARRPGVAWEKTSRVLRGLFTSALSRPDIPRALALASEVEALSEQHGDMENIAWSAGMRAFANLCAGTFETAATDFDRSAALYRSIPEPPPALRYQRPINPSFFSAVSSLNLWLLGYPHSAQERLKVTAALASESGSKAALESVVNFAVFVSQCRREVERTRENAEALLTLATELSNCNRSAAAKIFLGWSLAASGERPTGIDQMRRALTEFRAAASGAFNDYFLALIAGALGEAGRLDEALETIDQSATLIEKSGDRFYEAEIYRLKGELLLGADASNSGHAEQLFRTAIEVARKQKARSWELRATTSFARLLRDTNRRDQARSMLADIYNWFTEGFDTADLKDAKVLLDELSM